MTTSSSEKSIDVLDDFLGDLATDDPARFYRLLRESDPVHYNPRWGGWVLTRYEDVSAGFRDHARLSSNRMAGPWGSEASRRGDDGEMTLLYRTLGGFFAWMDPPEHTRFRRLLSATFTPKSVEQMRPRVVSLVDELVAGLPREEPFDFIDSFSFHLPAIVISEYLGTPPEDREYVKKLSKDLSAMIFVQAQKGSPREDRVAMGESAIAGFVDYFQAVIDDHKGNLCDDLISRMLTVEEDGESLTDEEIISQCILMLFAGHETTANLLANGMVAFDQFPDQWQALRAEPGLARGATEEMLRFDGPIAAQGRWARSDFALHDKEIKQGDRVMLVQWAANRDPDQFADPDRFDITRTPNRHLGFGFGIHMCLGAPLARLEVDVALQELSRRFERIEIATDPVKFTSSLTSRTLSHLDVVLPRDSVVR
jgi:cytochrome P450